MIIYNKLVRDKIPQIIKESGKKATIKVLDEAAYEEMLNNKLYEELEEYKQEKDIEELADLVEVVYAILENKGITIEEFENIRLMKQMKRGGFKEKLLLVKVEEQ